MVVTATRSTVGPRFEVPGSVAPGAALVRAQVRRAIRSLVGQRGGTMLMHAWGSGAVVRVECVVSGATASVAIRCEDEVVAAVVRDAGVLFADECARCGCALARIEFAGPASAVLPAA
jgi:hypothetical protein